MKIEVCEQLVKAWLKHIKGCQIVETNWTPSPVSTHLTPTEIKAVTEFVDKVKKEMEDENLDIFKKSTVEQFVKQCEIDVVGTKFSEGAIDELYLVDSAFHENGVGYKSAVATIMKKLLRAVVVADLIFKTVPPRVLFVAPKCGLKLKGRLDKALAKLEGIIKSYYPSATLTLVFNEEFYSQIYTPLVEQIDNIADDNDLFLRSVKLAKTAESYAPKPPKPPKPSKPSKASKTASVPVTPVTPVTSVTSTPLTIGQYAKNVFTTLLKTGQLSPTMISDLLDEDYCKKTFKIYYPVLADYSSSADLKHYYKNFRVLGMYSICFEWYERSRIPLDNWIVANGFIV